MMEMSAMQPGMNFYGDLPVSYVMTVNLDAPAVKKIEKDNGNDNNGTPETQATITQLVDLALLANGLLKGEALSKFIKRNMENV
jgi:molecular chaperone HtpG